MTTTIDTAHKTQQIHCIFLLRSLSVEPPPMHINVTLESYPRLLSIFYIDIEINGNLVYIFFTF